MSVFADPHWLLGDFSFVKKPEIAGEFSGPPSVTLTCSRCSPELVHRRFHQQVKLSVLLQMFVSLPRR